MRSSALAEDANNTVDSLKGGDPAAPSGTATLLRLHPSHRHCRRGQKAASGKTSSHGVTGGVYKARERIHRGMLIRDY